MHEFKDSAIDGTSNVYQDTNGENLTLYKNYVFGGENCSLLKDSGDNYAVFDTSGRLVRLIPAPCDLDTIENARATVIKYNGDKIEKVYDTRSEEGYLTFEYSDKNLTKITVKTSKASQNDKSVEFTYDISGNLISRKNGDLIENYEYTILGSWLKKIVSEETKTAVEVEYRKDSNRVSNTVVGYIDETGNFVQKSKNRFSYKITDEGLSSETEVTNEKGICIVYMFNRLGELVSSFEKNGSNLKTLQNEPGKKITGNNSYKTRINDGGVEDCDGEYKHSSEIALCREGEEDIKNFSVNCYVKLNNWTSKNLQAIVCYRFDGEDYTSGVKIDKNASEVWQKVCVPLNLPRDTEASDIKISSFSFGIYDEYGNTVSFSYSDLLVTPYSGADTILSNGEKTLDLKQIRSVILTTTKNKTKYLTVGKELDINRNSAILHTVLLTYNDLLETAKSLYRKSTDGGEFFFGGGKSRYSGIESVKLVDRFENEYELINLSTGKCGFIFEQYSTDNSSTTRIQTTFQTNGILSEKIISCEDKSSCSFDFTSYDGRRLYEEDAYGVRTVYEYDKYYNLTEVRRVKLNSSGRTLKEMILSQSEYDTQGEYLLNESSGYSSSSYTYNKPFESLKQETERSFNLSTQKYTDRSLKKEIAYDMNGRAESVSLKNGATEILKNTVTYKDGKIRTVTDGAIKYGIRYDMANDEVSYSIFDDDIETDIQKRKQIYGNSNQTTYIDEYYRGEETDTVTTVSDKYGKMLSMTDGTNTVEYTYTDEYNGFGGAELIKTITDPYEGKVYTYNYDHDGKMCGWNISGDTLSLQQISGTETKYIFGKKEKYKTKIEYDEEVVNEPRISGVTISSDLNGDAKDDWTEIEMLTSRYTYDELGLVSRKEIGGGAYEYEYVTTGSGKVLPNLKEVDYNANGNRWVYAYGYDERGNLTSIRKNHEINGDKKNRTTTYGYDVANRLQSEKISENGIVMADRTFAYQEGNGRLKWMIDKADSTKSINYSYDYRGRLERYTQNNTTYNYFYDNYGNVKSKRIGTRPGIEYKWERGNLLKEVTKEGKTIKYEYNHNNVRCRKEINGKETRYYLDGVKILGEEREGKTIRYFYDQDGVTGLSIDGEIYRYVKDGQGNIVAIVDFLEMVVAKYEYDSMGRTTVRTNTGLFDTSEDSVGNMNPFRWKSCYYDAESGLYNVNGRYYEADRGGYIDAMEADSIEGSAYELLGLDRNGIGCLTLLLLKGNEANIETGIELYADPLYDPEAGVTWVDKHGPKLFLSGLSILLGIVMVATGNVGGVTLIVSGALGIASAALSEQLAGAAGMAVTGIQTIALGLKSLSCCTPYGIVAMVIGAGCVAFATAEAQEGLGYGNWMKDAGMSDGWYSGLMVATNVAAIAVNIAGPKQCFKEGTLVSCLNENGEEVRIPIENIAVGTLVLAYDEETGEQAYKPVLQLFKNETKQWCTICVEVDGQEEEIISTPGHKYYLPNNTEPREVGEKQEHESYTGLSEKWVSACKLKAGDKVLLSNGEYGIIQSVKVEELLSPETTYNLEVEDFHTYYVGENPVCVHNVGCNGYDNHVIDKKDNLRIDLERGGSGEINMHLHVGKTNKYMFDGQDSFIGAGKLNKTNFVKSGIKKGIKTAKRLGWRL